MLFSSPVFFAFFAAYFFLHFHRDPGAEQFLPALTHYAGDAR
jgi:hypothetical protein